MSLGFQILVVVVYALAVMRLVRLINADTILDPLRIKLAQRQRSAMVAEREAQLAGQAEIAEGHRRRVSRWATVTYFVGCPWCVGMWLAFLTAWVPLYVPENPVARYVALALAVSHLIGVMARFTDTEEVAIESDEGQ